MQTVCNVERKAVSSPSLQHVSATTLVAFPVTTTDGSVLCSKEQTVVEKGKETSEPTCWKDAVDAEIKNDMNKLGLEVEVPKPKSRCTLL